MDNASASRQGEGMCGRMPVVRENESALDTSVIDARAPGLGPADLVFVSGTRLARPAELAADLYLAGLAPFVVVTGGSNRQADGLNEADHHRGVLVAPGVREHAVIVENESSNTAENVLFAMPLIEQRCGALPTTVIAVVKRFHRRALVTLARYTPTVERIYAVDYEPDVALAPPSPDRIQREVAHFASMTAEGIDLLFADGDGWRRISSAD